eukprot:12203-Heterococcus_DN1.PRE.4
MKHARLAASCKITNMSTACTLLRCVIDWYSAMQEVTRHRAASTRALLTIATYLHHQHCSCVLSSSCKAAVKYKCSVQFVHSVSVPCCAGKLRDREKMPHQHAVGQGSTLLRHTNYHISMHEGSRIYAVTNTTTSSSA